MRRKPRLWVVELWMGADWWEPTIGAAIRRDDGREQLATWKGRNPADRLRLAQYERVEPPKRKKAGR